MASVVQTSPNHWVVHLASRTESDSEITVELRMSRAVAESLARAEALRAAALDDDLAGLSGKKPDGWRDCARATSEDIGSVVLRLLGPVSAVGRVKARIASLDQGEVTNLIDREVEAVRASCP